MDKKYCLMWNCDQDDSNSTFEYSTSGLFVRIPRAIYCKAPATRNKCMSSAALHMKTHSCSSFTGVRHTHGALLSAETTGIQIAGQKRRRSALNRLRSKREREPTIFQLFMFVHFNTYLSNAAVNWARSFFIRWKSCAKRKRSVQRNIFRQSFIRLNQRNFI